MRLCHRSSYFLSRRQMKDEEKSYVGDRKSRYAQLRQLRFPKPGKPHLENCLSDHFGSQPASIQPASSQHPSSEPASKRRERERRSKSCNKQLLQGWPGAAQNPAGLFLHPGPSLKLHLLSINSSPPPGPLPRRNGKIPCVHE